MMYFLTSLEALVSSDEWKFDMKVAPVMSLSGLFTSMYLTIHALGALSRKFVLNDISLENTGQVATSVPAVVPPVDSIPSSLASVHANRSKVAGLSKSVAETSGMLKSCTNTLFATVIPWTALTIGLAIRTLLPKLRRLNLNRRIVRPTIR